MLAYRALRARISTFAMKRPGGDEAWSRVDPDDTGAIQSLASCLTGALHTVSTLRGSPQPIACGWIGWIRATLEESPHPVGAQARLLLDRIEEPFRAFDAACGALVSAPPAASRDRHAVPASPLDPGLLVGLAAQRTAFILSTGAALGTTLTALAHPSTAHAMLTAQRDAAARALRRLAQLQRLGTPGATALTAGLAVITRDAFLCDAVLTSHVSVEDQPGALVIGLLP